MRLVFLVLLCMLPAVLCVSIDQEWAAFKVKYNRNYHSDSEEDFRFNIFKTDVAKAQQLTAASQQSGVADAAVFGINQYADWDANEFKSTMLNYKPFTGLNGKLHEVAKAKRHHAHHHSAKKASTGYVASDWRTKNAITPVKDQGQCGSCLAFSVTETLESTWFLQGKGALPVLAPQQIVDCDTKEDQGCNGGDPVATYNDYVKNTGLEAEATYPYTSGLSGQGGTCQVNSSSTIITAPIKTFTYATTPCTDACTSQDEVTLSANVAATGPASICVYAESWQTYTSGILTNATSCPSAYTSLDHCVQLVGMGTDGSSNYWIVRNSWAASWGELGYIRVQVGQNLCGIADESTFVQY